MHIKGDEYIILNNYHDLMKHSEREEGGIILLNSYRFTFWRVGANITYESSTTINKLYKGIHVRLATITSHWPGGIVVHDA